MTEEVGAGFYIPYGTALCALRERGRLEPGQTLLVLGAAGAVGQASVQVGRALGARVIGTSRHESRRDAVMSVGADGFVATAGLTGDAVRDRLTRRGVGTAVHYPVPVHLQSAYAAFAAGARLPVTEAVCRDIVSLPMFPGLGRDEAGRVADAMLEAAGVA